MKNERKSICVIGLGYIGLPTAALLASKGYRVHGVDVVQQVVDTINQGKIHIIEPDLDVFTRSAVQSGNLKAHLKPVKSDIFIIAVPTPFKENHTPNIDYVIDGTRSIVPHLEPGNLVILESTSPVGTTEKIAQFIFSERPELRNKIFIAHCPERVLPGHIMYELVHNDRLTGGINQDSTEAAAKFYAEFVKGQIFQTNAKTAEMAKLTENTYRDVNIAFANELSMICHRLNIDVWELIRLANRHPRVNILQPGCGVGGHCIAVDPWFIIDSAKEDAQVIRRARDRNEDKKIWVVNRIIESAEKLAKKLQRLPVIACMGLAFKPNIDDLRESPALEITNSLISLNKFTVLPVEPNVTQHTNLTLHDGLRAFQMVDIVVFLVKHKEFESLVLENKTVLDFCGLCSP